MNFSHRSLTTSPPSQRLGAWWLGFFICGTLVFFATIPFWFFPRSLQRPDDEKKHDNIDNGEEKHEKADYVAKEENLRFLNLKGDQTQSDENTTSNTAGR